MFANYLTKMYFTVIEVIEIWPLSTDATGVMLHNKQFGIFGHTYSGDITLRTLINIFLFSYSLVLTACLQYIWMLIISLLK